MLAVVVTAGVSGGVWVHSLQGRPYDVVAILGQSNALGAGKGWQPLGADAPGSGVYQMSSWSPVEDLVLPGIDPLLNPQPLAGSIGFGTTFAKEYVDATGRDVLLVPVAIGETGFTEANGITWDPDNSTADTNLYDRSVEQIGDALAKNPDSRLVAVLWHQGEGDVRTMTGDEYGQHLDATFDDLRDRFGDVPILVGGMSPDRMAEMDGIYDEINAVHQGIGERIDNAAFVDPPAGMHNDGETIHFNAAGQRELGRSYWDAYASLAE